MNRYIIKSSYSDFIHTIKRVKQDILIFSFLLILPLFSLAQEYSLSGSVLGPDNTPIPYADVVLQDKNSEIIKWDLTDENGKYSIENIKPASYTLKFSIVGYAAKETEIVIDKDIAEQIMVLEEEVNELNEVVLVQPKTEYRSDRLIFHVQNTSLSNGSTWSALTKTPSLFKTGDEILVRGRDVPIIFINDKRIYLSSGELKQLLENTPADVLKSIEVIYTPSAKYDAEGKAVINIVMSKNLSIGYNGNLRTVYEQGVYPKFRFSTGHFYKKDNINLYARYTLNRKRTYALFRNRVTFFTDDLPSGNWASETRDDMKRSIHDINANIDYTINPNHSLGISGLASFIPNKIEYTNSHTEAIDSSFHSVNRGKYMRDNFALSIDYKYNISDGKKLTANIHHNNYNYDHDQTVTTDYFDGGNSFIRDNMFTNDKEQYVKINTSQLDYTSSGKENVFEAGIKWSYITFDNRIDQVNVEGDGMETYDLFLYDETNFAAYLNYEKNWKHWDLNLGIRGENTAIKGISAIEGQTNNQRYFKLFPSISLGYRPSENHNFSLSYNKKIDRPRYSTLNPFRLFLNDNSYVTGNPGLLPTIHHRFNFTYNIKRELSMSLYFNQSIDPISTELPYIDNEDNKIIYRNDNLDKITEYGMYVQWNKALNSWWEINTFSSFFYMASDFIATQNNNEILNVNHWTTFHRVSNYFTFSKTFTGDIGFRYNSKYAEGNYTKRGQSNLYFGLQKTLWNRRATLSFYANDIFDQLAYNTETRYLDQRINEYSNFENRTFEINFIYRFGNYRLRTNRKTISNEEKDRL